MKVLIVASLNKGAFVPFIVEQVEALRRLGVECEYYGVTGHGVMGYLSAFPGLVRKVHSFNPDIIHAHYGLSGLLACMCWWKPVVVTYHGSDINDASVLRWSRWAIRLSSFNIFVSQRNVETAGVHSKYALIPCGVNVPSSFMTKSEARALLGWGMDARKVLFAGAFDNEVKNYPLAKAAVDLLPDVELVELKGYSRDEVFRLMCACDALLMTSYTEGSPQVVKEAMVCGLPIVSVDVGDVAYVTAGVEGCYLTRRDAFSLSRCVESAISYCKYTNGRHRINDLGLTNNIVASRLFEAYIKLSDGKK